MLEAPRHPSEFPARPAKISEAQSQTGSDQFMVLNVECVQHQTAVNEIWPRTKTADIRKLKIMPGSPLGVAGVQGSRSLQMIQHTA